MSADFLDTNVLVHAFDGRSPAKHATARRLVAQAVVGQTAVISHQVVQEALNVFASKASVVMTPDRLRTVLREVLLPLWHAAPTPALYRRALDLGERYGFAFYDSLIVASAVEAGCSRLLSEDFHHGQVIEGVTIVNPFLD